MKSKEPSQEIDDILDEETVNFDTDDTDDDFLFLPEEFEIVEE